MAFSFAGTFSDDGTRFAVGHITGRVTAWDADGESLYVADSRVASSTSIWSPPVWSTESVHPSVPAVAFTLADVSPARPLSACRH